MRKTNSDVVLKTLGCVTPQRTKASGETPPTERCGVSPSGACRSIACARCAYVPRGVWACSACVTQLGNAVQVLAFHGDASCHYCGASPLLTLRITDGSEN